MDGDFLAVSKIVPPKKIIYSQSRKNGPIVGPIRRMV